MRPSVRFAAAVVAACAALAALTWWFTTPPTLAPAVGTAPKAAPVVAKPPHAAPKPAPPISRTPPFDPSSIDPDIQRMADSLSSRDQTPGRDLEVVNDFISLYSKVFQGNPIGDNADITAVLTGQNYRKGILFPPDSPMIVKGQIVDRWGTPYWFHAASGTHMEIRSAGPDRQLFTPDDVVFNPSPDGMGANGNVARAQ